jgi:hypothetical protein
VTTVVFLIPGTLGFGAFGPPTAPILEYFADVKKALRPIPSGYQVLVHEPPPTGSFEERVRSLHEAVWKLMHGTPLPHSPAVTASRVLLVGHSTGGVDARLLMNPKFHWPGPATDDERALVRAIVDQIVTISAPFKGTPVVDHIALIRDPVLEVVRVLTMTGIFQDGTLDAFLLRVLSGAASPLLPVKGIGRVASSIVAETARRSAIRTKKASLSDAALVANQVQNFLYKIETDRKLYKDVSLAEMAALDAQIAGGDFPHILSYVTVSPAPRIEAAALQVVPYFVYCVLYFLTTRVSMPGPPPTGARFFGPAHTVATVLADPVSCDGGVPTRSQTLNGVAEGIVLGDHWDVIGSFRGGSGADVVRSGSGFDQARFAELWGDIAARL